MGLLAYSGITTKVRAMESRLLKPEQFQQMAELEDVRSAADYLKGQPAYAEVFDGLDDTRLHRGSYRTDPDPVGIPGLYQALPFLQRETEKVPGSLF